MHGPLSLRAKAPARPPAELKTEQKPASPTPSEDAGAQNVIFPRRKAGQNKKSGGKSGVIVTYEVLAQCFDMPLHKACKTLGVCATAFKKVCRKLGVMKWPYKDAHMPPKKVKPSAKAKPAVVPVASAKPAAATPKSAAVTPKAGQASAKAQPAAAAPTTTCRVKTPAVRSPKAHSQPKARASDNNSNADKHAEPAAFRPANRPNRQPAAPVLNSHGVLKSQHKPQRRFPAPHPVVVEPEVEDKEVMMTSDSSEHDSADSEDFTSCSSPEWAEGDAQEEEAHGTGEEDSMFMPHRDEAALYLDEDRLAMASSGLSSGMPAGYGGMYNCGEPNMAPEIFGSREAFGGRETWQTIDTMITDDLWV